MKRPCYVLALIVLAGGTFGPSFAQNPGEFIYYDTSLTACPNQNQVLSFFCQGVVLLSS